MAKRKTKAVAKRKARKARPVKVPMSKVVKTAWTKVSEREIEPVKRKRRKRRKLMKIKTDYVLPEGTGVTVPVKKRGWPKGKKRGSRVAREQPETVTPEIGAMNEQEEFRDVVLTPEDFKNAMKMLAPTPVEPEHKVTVTLMRTLKGWMVQITPDSIEAIQVGVCPAETETETETEAK